MKFLELGDIEKSEAFMNESLHFKIYNPLDLKNSNIHPLLTTNQMKHLIIY